MASKRPTTIAEYIRAAPRQGQPHVRRLYGFTDYDGRRPDWGRHKSDFSEFPPRWMELFRTGTDLEIQWLTTLAARARRFRAKIPY